ncbi:MAG: hypothetical protein R3301_17485 [Saprospiraceae bacterium]|nr:hypothetical protein [Saprospiraceae bacterium]
MRSLSWGGREFRKLPPGTTPEFLLQTHTTLRKTIRTGDTTTIRNALNHQYPTGAIAEPYVNELGYHALRAGSHSVAITLFTFNTRYYPASATPCDRT